MDYEPDIRLQIRVRNARILRAMKVAGIRNVSELCRQAGVGNLSHVGAIVNFKLSPIVRKTGEWKEIAIAIATALHVMPEQLWPEYLRRIEALKTEVHLDVTAEQFGAISASGVGKLIAREEVANMLKKLTPRFQKVIEMRFGLNGNGDCQYRDIADELGVSIPRVQQMEKTALERMRARRGD